MRLTHSYSSIKLFENCPLRYYRQRIKKDVVEEENEVSKYGERVHAYFENRLKGGKLPPEAIQYEPLCQAVENLAKKGTLYIEQELALTENLVPTDWFNHDAWLRSKLDVLIVTKNEAIVIDWKTGKRQSDNLQMQLNAAQVFKHYPDIKQVKTTLVWLKPMQLDIDVYKRENVNKLWIEILRRIERIHEAYTEANWPAKPSGLCRYCPCRYDCEYAIV